MQRPRVRIELVPLDSGRIEARIQMIGQDEEMLVDEGLERDSARAALAAAMWTALGRIDALGAIR